MEKPDALDPSEITLVLPEAEGGSEPEISTLALPVKELDEIRTTDIDPSLLPLPQAPASTAAQKTPASGKAWKLWLGLGAAALVAAGFVAYVFLRQRPTETAPATLARTQAPPETVPPELRSYMDQAKAGDAQAMHMIALMYWNGLNVRQDRVKGLDWYRKAAAAGDKAAQQELGAIEGR